MNQRLTFKGIGSVLKDSFNGFLDDKVFKLSGALAYFTIFAIGPMLIVIIYFADIFYGREAIEGTIYGQIKGFVGADAAAQIQAIIKNATLSTQNKFTATIGFITLFIAATGVFTEIQDSINTIWNLKTKPKKEWLKMVLNRLISFSVIVSLGFILLVSLVINGLIEALMAKLQASFPQLTVVMVYIVNVLITFLITAVLFGIIFKALPDAKIKWRDVMTGSIVTAILFMMGKFGITYYIGNSNIGTTYGAAGSLVVLLLWVYYSAIILYFGAEFTKSYAARYGGSIQPNKYAVWIKHIEVEDGKGSLRQQEVKKKIENEQTGDEVKIT
ncbi:MAG: YihY/virulence factor BrkB family protein [Bacteroidota bacterium]